MVATMESSAASTRQRVLAGILFMCGAGLLFPIMSGFAKFLGEDGYNSLQVSWARAFGHIVFMMAVFVPKFGLGMLRTRRPVIQLTRSTMLFMSNATNFFAITFIPLAKTASISLMAPLMVVPLAWAILGERTTPGRLLALGAGFVGVLIVIRPGTELFHWASLLAVVSAVGYAVYQVLTRKVAGIDPPETSTIYSSLVGGFGMFAVLPFVWRTPDNLRDVLFFCSLGVIGAVGHYLVARAFNNAPANIVSPFQYMQLIGSVTVGYFFFGDFPDLLTWIGAAIIVGSGLYIGWSQTRREKAS
jgi:drug/metabolite transporter (DMT)-like permease